MGQAARVNDVRPVGGGSFVATSDGGDCTRGDCTRALRPGRIWSTSSPECLSLMGQLRSNLANFGPELVDIGPTLTEFGPALAHSDPNLAEFGRCRAKFGKAGPEFLELGPSTVETGPMLADGGLLLVEFGRFRARLSRHQATFHMALVPERYLGSAVFLVHRGGFAESEMSSEGAGIYQSCRTPPVSRPRGIHSRSCFPGTFRTEWPRGYAR